MFWFDKRDSRATYLDKRQETHLLKNKDRFECLKIEPDMGVETTWDADIQMVRIRCQTFGRFGADAGETSLRPQEWK